MFPHSLLNGFTWYPLLFDTPQNTIRSVAIWFTVILVIAYTVASFLLKPEKTKRFRLIFSVCCIAYACALCTLFLILTFQEDGVEKLLFIPLLCLLISIALTAVILAFHRSKLVQTTLFLLCGGAFLATLVCMAIHFYSGNAAEKNWLTNADVQSIALYVSSVLALGVLLLIVFTFGKEEPQNFTSKSLTYAAICIAMSFALSYLRIVRLPQGGSITPASLLPLMLYAYLFGVRKGVFAGFAYGLLQAFQDPAVLHPAQFLLDYPMAFAWIGLAGVFGHCEKLNPYPALAFALGGVFAGLGRFFMHFLSGTFAFGAFAPSGTPAALYSFLYQAGYVLPDLAIAVAVGALLFSSKSFSRETKKLRAAFFKKEL